MPQQRNRFLNVRRRLAVAGIGALGFSGLLFGGFAIPAGATGTGGTASVDQWFESPGGDTAATGNENPAVDPAAETDDPGADNLGTENDDPGASNPNNESSAPRCATSRTKPCQGKVDPEVIVDPLLDHVDPPTTAAPASDPANTVAGTGDQTAAPAPDNQVLAGEDDRTAPGPAPAGGLLPRTGTGIGLEVFLAFALLTAGIAVRRLARRPRPSLEG